jgi:hypothetical protein
VGDAGRCGTRGAGGNSALAASAPPPAAAAAGGRGGGGDTMPDVRRGHDVPGGGAGAGPRPAGGLREDAGGLGDSDASGLEPEPEAA